MYNAIIAVPEVAVIYNFYIVRVIARLNPLLLIFSVPGLASPTLVK